MPTDMLTTDALTPPEGMDAVGVLRELTRRGDVVLVLNDDGESVAGFYQAASGEHDDLLKVPPDFRWEVPAKLCAQRLRNRSDSSLRTMNLHDAMPAHVREVPSLDEMLGVTDAAE